MKHTQFPHQLGKTLLPEKLLPVDKLVYVYLRSHTNSEGITFVSVDTLALECVLNWRTVANSLKRLLEAKEITLVVGPDKQAKTRSKTYQITKDNRKFERFSQECLDHLRTGGYTTNEKCVLIGLHEFSYKTSSYGEWKDNLNLMAHKINMPLATFKRSISSLINKGVITVNKNHDNQLVRRIEWQKIMMDVLYRLNKHDEDIQKNTENIYELQEKISTMQRELDKLRKKVNNK